MSEYRLQTPSQGIIGPVRLDTVRDLAEGGVIQKGVLVSRDNGPFLPLASFSELLSQVGDSLGEAPEPSYSGDVGVLSFFKIFYRLYEAGSTGLLTVRDGTRRKEIYIESGGPVFVSSSTLRERLGDFLVARGCLRPEQLSRALAVMQEEKLQLGQALVNLGMLTSSQLASELREQQMLRLVDLCRWESGRYAYYNGTRYRGARVEIRLDTPELVLRAARAMPEKTILLRLGSHLHQLAHRVPSRLADQCVDAFSADEQAALEKIDGKSTAVQVVTCEQGQPLRRRAALTVLYLLWEVGGITFRSRT